MRFTCAVISDDQKPLIFHGLVKLKLRNGDIYQLLGHFLGDNVRLYKLPGGSRLVGFPELNNGFNGIKLNQLSILHLICPLRPLFSRVYYQDIVGRVSSILGMIGLGIGYISIYKNAVPGNDYRFVSGKSLKKPQGILFEVGFKKNLDVVK